MHQLDHASFVAGSNPTQKLKQTIVVSASSSLSQGEEEGSFVVWFFNRPTQEGKKPECRLLLRLPRHCVEILCIHLYLAAHGTAKFRKPAGTAISLKFILLLVGTNSCTKVEGKERSSRGELITTCLLLKQQPAEIKR